MKILEKIDNNNDIDQMINELPTQLRTILGKIHIPQDKGNYITSAKELGPLIAASNGSLREEDNSQKGGYAYSIQRFDSNTHRIQGYATSPISDTISSYTTEMYGYLAILIIIRLMEYNKKTLK